MDPRPAIERGPAIYQETAPTPCTWCFWRSRSGGLPGLEVVAEFACLAREV